MNTDGVGEQTVVTPYKRTGYATAPPAARTRRQSGSGLFASQVVYGYAEVFILLKGSFFFAILEEPLACGSVQQEWAVVQPGLLSRLLAPSLRNKYIHHCTNILIQKQHWSECLWSRTSLDGPSYC